MKKHPVVGIVAADALLITLLDGRLHVLLSLRENPDEPYAGRMALPGSYVRPGTDRRSSDAARRALRDKAGIEPPYMEQLATFDGPDRDPRGWSVSTAYFALVHARELDGRDPARTLMAPVDEPGDLPFDHADMVRVAAGRVRAKAGYSNLPLFLMEPEFTLDEMLDTYRQILDPHIDKSSFRRFVTGQKGIIEPVPGDARRALPQGRPASLWRMATRDLALFDRPLVGTQARAPRRRDEVDDSAPWIV